MGGNSAAAAPTRYAGVQVQTSSLGVQIPIVWGTGRCKCNLVDYLDFKSVAQKAASGKGGVTTGYSYSATIILALCEGPIQDITQVWVDGKTYAYGSLGSGVANTKNTSALSQVGLSISGALGHHGDIGQAVWPYLTSAHPSHAIGYSGLAIVYAENYPLDSGAATPQHSFEVVSNFTITGLPDANPEVVLTDFFTNSRYGLPNWGANLLDPVSFGAYSTYCLAQNLLVSPVLDQERQASDFLTEMMTATNSNLLWSEGLLKIVVYGDTAVSGNGAAFTPDLTPVYALTDDDFVPKSDGDDALMVDIEDQSDAYNIVQLEYLDRTNQYSTAIATANDAANISQYGRRKQDPTTVHVICNPTVAQTAAQLLLQRTLYIRKQFKFTVSWVFQLLEPGDIVTLTHAAMALAAYPVRIIQIDEAEDGTFEITAEDLLVGISHAPLYNIQTGQGAQLNRNLDPGWVERNLVTWSGDVTRTGWTLNLVTASGGVADPLGGSAAQQLTATASNGSHNDVTPTAAVIDGAAGVPYTYSRYLKAGTSHLVNVGLGSVSGTGVEAQVDLSAGTIAAASASGGAVALGQGLVGLGSGWYRAWVSGQLPTGASVANGYVFILNASGAQSYAAAGTESVEVFGAQFEPGEAMNAYVPTLQSPAVPQIFNPPVALTPGNVETWAAVAGQTSNWGGANIWVSYDASDYELIGAVTNGPARYGHLTTAYPASADPDTADTLAVDLSASMGDLTSAAEAVANAAGTLCLVDGELVSFSTATATAAPYNYDLTTYTRRGLLGTAIAAHAAGAPFVRLDQAIFDFPYYAAQAGVTAYVKFQSFNQWGFGVQPLSTCAAYPCIPVPAGARAPGSGAWTAIGTELSNAGQSIPAIVITGASDNASATLIEFDYRVSGTSVWASGGTGGAATTRKEITSVQSGQAYDVSVLYLVNGVASNREIIATGITVGQVATGPSGGGSGAGPGATLLNDSAAGAGKTFTCPPGSYAHVDIVLTGVPGAGAGTGGKGGSTDYGGGGGMVVVVKGFPVTPGTTIFTYTLPSAVGSNATCTASGLSLAATPGTNAGAGSGIGGLTSGISNSATGATSVTNYAGHNGGLTDTWDGGGPGATINVATGTVTAPAPDNTSDGSPGAIPGQGGAGQWIGNQPGGGCNLLIIART